MLKIKVQHESNYNILKDCIDGGTHVKKARLILFASLIAVTLLMSVFTATASPPPKEPTFTLVQRLDGFNDTPGGPGIVGDRFGISATADTDFNQDGFIDIVVGSARSDPGGLSGKNEGTVFVLSGKSLLDGASQEDAILIAVNGEPTSNNNGELGFRQSVHSRDVTHDGVPDLLVAAWLADPVIDGSTRVDAGTTFLYDGAMLLNGASQSDALLFRLDGQAGDRLGRPSMFVGDINQDGVEDFFVGAHRAEVQVGGTTIFNAGKGFLVSGRDLSILNVFEGSATNDFLGRSVMPLGDVNKDGFVDLDIGASQGDGGQVSSIDGLPVNPEPGFVNVYSGKDYSLITTLLPPADEPTGSFGQTSVYNYAPAFNSDFNKDGVPDIVVGSPEARAGLVGPPGNEGFPRTGRAYVFSGMPPYQILYIFNGEVASSSVGAGFPTPNGQNIGDVFGDALAVVQDMNRDGVPDILAGAPRGDGIDPTPGDAVNELTDSGYAKMFSGKDGNLLARFDGSGIRTNMGHHVNGALDVDKNGHPDLLFGSDLTDFGGTDAGSLFWYTLKRPGKQM